MRVILSALFRYQGIDTVELYRYDTVRYRYRQKTQGGGRTNTGGPDRNAGRTERSAQRDTRYSALVLCTREATLAH